MLPSSSFPFFSFGCCVRRSFFSTFWQIHWPLIILGYFYQQFLLSPLQSYTFVFEQYYYLHFLGDIFDWANYIYDSRRYIYASNFFFGGLFETISWVILFLLFISLERISRHFRSISSNRCACFLPSGLARDLALKDPSDVPEEISAQKCANRERLLLV